MYSQIYRTLRLGWPGGLTTRRRLQELSETQWLSKTELDAYQFSNLRHIIHYAYEKVPYYRKSFSELGIHPTDIEKLEDIHYLPFLTRDDINKNLETLVSVDYQGRVLKNLTGGSTGTPMKFFIDESFWWWNAALEFRGRSWYGVKEGEKIAWIWGAPQEMRTRSFKARLRSSLMRYRYLNTFDMNENRMQDFAEELISWKPAMIRGYVSALTLFAEFIKHNNFTGIKPKLIETTAEVLDINQREAIEEVFDCPVVDCYSARELGTISYQCEYISRHISETRYVEIINGGRSVPQGELGEVVITSLTQYSMPLIRYKIDDMGIIDCDECSCKRGLPILREIIGKKLGILVTSDGRYVYGSYFSTLLQKIEDVKRYQVHQYTKEEIVVRLICKKRLSEDTVINIQRKIKEHFGESTDISIVQENEIELTPAGKHQFVVSDVEPDFSRSR